MKASVERKSFDGLTGIYFRAQDASDKWGDYDIAELTDAAVHEIAAEHMADEWTGNLLVILLNRLRTVVEVVGSEHDN